MDPFSSYEQESEREAFRYIVKFCLVALFTIVVVSLIIGGGLSSLLAAVGLYAIPTTVSLAFIYWQHCRCREEE